MKKILFAFVALFMFSACNQDELNRLKGQVETLQKENASLKSQVAELSETEQNKFGKAADLLSNAKSAADYRKAEEAFASFAAKYPISSYLEQAQKKQDDAKTKAEQLEWIDDQRKSIKTAMENKDWNAASKTVWLIRKVISKEEYDGYVKKIYEEKNKPIKVKNINELIAYSDRYYGERIEVYGCLTLPMFLDLKEKILRLSNTCGTHGISDTIEIDYSRTNKIAYFIEYKNKGLQNNYFKVVGFFSQGLISGGAIAADTIEMVK